MFTAHSLLQSFTTNLLSITKRHNILCLILNSTLSTPAPNTHARQNSAYATHGNHSISPSIFASNNHLRPSLGALFSSLPELHLLLSRLPTRRQDAELLYGGADSNEEGPRATTRVQHSYILEVIKDEQGVRVADEDGMRWVNREQKWGAFEIHDEVVLRDTFGRSGTMAAMGQWKARGTVEKGAREGVGAVARDYGFGRHPRGL